MASPFFFDGFLQGVRFQTFFGVHFFEPTVFVLQLLQAGHHGRIHTADLRASFVKARTAHTVLTAKLWNGTLFSACFRIDKIWLSEKRVFVMQNLPACNLRKILLLITALYRGDYPLSSMMVKAFMNLTATQQTQRHPITLFLTGNSGKLARCRHPTKGGIVR